MHTTKHFLSNIRKFHELCHIQIGKKPATKQKICSPTRWRLRTYPVHHMTLYLDHHQNQENHFQQLGRGRVHNGLHLISLLLYTEK